MSTSARVFYADSADPRQCIAADVDELADLMRRSGHGRARWLAWRSGAETLRAFTGARFVSVIAACVVVAAVVLVAV